MAIVRAVSGWSPVIITGRMPATAHVSTAARASARGGSIIATRPSRVISDSASSSVAPDFRAIARTRRPSAAMRCSILRIWSQPCCVRGTSLPDSHCRVQLASTSSAAPFEYATTPADAECSVVIRRRSEVNEISAVRGSRSLSWPGLSPALMAATTTAPSVGSPSTCQRPSRVTSRASEARTAA